MATAKDSLGIPRTEKKRAHCNLLMGGLNAALELGLVGPRDGENYWPRAPEEREHTFLFRFPTGEPAAAYLHARPGELTLHVALRPNGDLGWLAASNAGFDAGAAFVVGWVERDHGFWLQDCFEDTRIQRALLPRLAAVAIRPKGYFIGPFTR